MQRFAHPFPFLVGLGLALLSGCITFGSGGSSSDDGAPAAAPPDPTPIANDGVDPAPDPAAPRSSSYDVHELFASMSAVQDEHGITIEAALLHERVIADVDPDFVTLDQGDRFTATIGAATTPMRFSRDADDAKKVRYVARFTSAAKPVQVVVAFARGDGRPGAPYSQVGLGAPFDIVSASPVALRREDALPLAISTPSRTLDVSLAGSCVAGAVVPAAFDDHGKATLATSQLTASGDPPPNAPPTPAECDVVVQLQARTAGQVDSAFARGPFGYVLGIEGLQQRTFTTHLAQ